MDNQGPALDAILSRHGLEKKDLDVECPESIRNRIALEVKNWEMMGRTGFGFHDSQVAAIARIYQGEDERKKALLYRWRVQNGKKATNFKLAEALCSGGHVDLVDTLCEALKQKSVGDAHSEGSARSEGT